MAQKILVVDDVLPNVLLLAGYMKRLENVEVVTFTDPAEALLWCAMNEPNLVLLDYVMPQMNGCEFLHRFRNMGHLSDVPVVIVTADQSRETLNKALDAGANDFLRKPVDDAELIARVLNMLLLRARELEVQAARREAEASNANLAKANLRLKDDVAHRKRTEVALRESEERFRSVVNNSPTKIHIKDVEGRYVLVNSEAEKLFGVTEEEARGKTANEIFPDKQAGDFWAHDQAVLETGQTIAEEEEWLQDDGVHIFLTVKFPIRDGEGRITAIGAIGTDITERKNTELALREAQQQLNSIMNSVVDAVITYDKEGVIRSFNRAAERIFGYSMIEVLDRNIRILTPEPNAGDDDDYLSKVWSKDETTFDGIRPEIVGQRQNGTKFPLEVSISLMDLSEQTMFAAICRDNTERKKAEEERAELERGLSQAQKLESLGTLAGGIAHEINTPVQFVSDNTRFLKTAFADLSAVLQKHMTLLEAANAGGVLTDAVAEASAADEDDDTSYFLEEIPSAIEQSLEGLEQIAEIVRAIKEISYPNTKEKCSVDINKAITATITVSRNQWKYAAELETDLDTTLPFVPCLLGEFNQVILNLIVNAAHAIEDCGKESKGRIAISTSRMEGWAEIRISDTGAGIPKENYDKIFEQFFTTKEPGRGTGQGLAISRTIITKKHGGTFTFQSEVGKGTVFIIRLPIVDPEQSEVAAYHDRLTGVASQVLFQDRLSRAFARANRNLGNIAVLFFDLDNFKEVNDTLGHDVGDLMLKITAERLQTCVREVDTVARLGGDKFTVILEGMQHEQDAVVVARRILDMFAAPFDLNGHEVLAKVSIGIATYPTCGETTKMLVKNADTAMFCAKNLGGNAYRVYTPEPDRLQ